VQTSVTLHFSRGEHLEQLIKLLVYLPSRWTVTLHFSRGEHLEQLIKLLVYLPSRWTVLGLVILSVRSSVTRVLFD